MVVDPEISKISETLTGRAKIVCDLIAKNGSVTTAALEELGYKHPPRAIADVREAAIPVVMRKVRNPSNGRQMAEYSFGDPREIKEGRLEGRTTFPKRLKKDLAGHGGSRCGLCTHAYALTYLQIDHRVPYRIGGEPDSTDGLMLICRSCQRTKSWACEHCPNWTRQAPSDCGSCFWASPELYSHVATTPERRIAVVFSGEELPLYEVTIDEASRHGLSPAAFVKELLRRLG
jgi:5-methylcytosine-specific restriction endonuclease McrA